MRDDEKRDELRDGESPEPFRRSGSGGEYDPNGNWAAERGLDHGSGATIPGLEGAPTGAGDGGFGPEGDYGGAVGEPNADVTGDVNADHDALAKEAQKLGRPRPDRRTIGGSAAGEPDAGSRRAERND